MRGTCQQIIPDAKVNPAQGVPKQRSQSTILKEVAWTETTPGSVIEDILVSK